MDARTVLQWGDSGQMEWASPGMREWVAQQVRTRLGLPIRSTYVQIESRSLHLRPIKEDPRNRHQTDEIDLVRSLFVPGIGSHIRVITGTAYGETPSGAPAGAHRPPPRLCRWTCLRSGTCPNHPAGRSDR